jgi:hypothetical protein
MNNDKASAQRHHTIKRASERLGLSLNKEQIEQLVKQIQTNKGTFLERQSNRVSAWLLSIQGSQFVAIYDSHRKTLATVYPYSWWLERNPDEEFKVLVPSNEDESDEWL